MKLFKKALFPTLFIIVYIWLLITVFFWNNDISDIGTTIWLQILLIILWLLAIQTIPETYSKKLMLITLIIWVTLSVIWLIIKNTQHWIFILCTHLIFVIYIWERFHLVKSSKRFYLWRSAHRWLWSTSLLLALTYISTIRRTSTWINLNCEKLHDQTLWLIKQYVPNIQNNTWIIAIIEKIDTLSTQSFWQLLWVNDINSWNNLYFTWISSVFSGEQEQVLSGDSKNIWVLWSLLWYQQNLLNWIVNNQELIDAQVCDVTLKHINKIAENSDIKLITFVLLVLWLSFFMRSIMFIIGIINFIILALLFSMWWFKKNQTQQECEEISI